MQKPETSSDLLNMRPFRASNGRRQFAQRSGLNRYCRENVPGTVRLLSQISFDSRKFTYSAGAGESAQTALTKGTKIGVLDRQKNTYTVEEPATIAKLNEQLEVVWRLNPGLGDGRFVIQALFVDDTDNLYCGVTSGGDQATASFWRFKPNGSSAPKQVWQHKPGAYVRRIVVRGDLIYTLQNMPDRAQAFVVCYSNALSSKTDPKTSPLVEAWRTEVSYPANDLCLKDNGDVIGCSIANASRGIDPRFPLFTERTVDWRLTDLADFDRRVWAWWKASDQPAHYGKKQVSKGTNADGTEVPILQDDSDLPYWYDSSGNARDLFLSIRAAANTISAPRYDEKGIGGKPSIRFRGTTGGVAPTGDELQSGVSSSETAAYADAQRALIPSYIGAKSAMFILARFEDDRSGAPTTKAVFGINRATGGAGNAVSLFTNRNDAGAVAAGVGSYVDLPPAGGLGLGAGGQPLQFRYDEAFGNLTGTVLITIVNDGGDVSLPDGANVTHSLLRINGQPYDRFVSAAGSTTDAGYLGFFHGVIGAITHFRGHIAEIIILRDLSTAPKGLLSHPNYPRNINTVVANIYAAVTTANATEMEFIEGMLAHEYGISNMLPTGAYIPPVLVGPIAPGNYPHPFYRTAGPPRSPGSGTRSEPYQMHTKQGCVWKLDGSKGELQWVLTGSSAEDGGGLGYSVAVSGDSIFSVGPKLAVGSPLIDGTVSAVGTGNLNIRKFTDLNIKGQFGYDTSTSLATTNWNVGLGTIADDFDTSDIKCGLDDFANLYVPISYPAIGPSSMKVYASAPDQSGASNVGNELLTYGNVATFGVVVPPAPSYRFGAVYDFDRNPSTDARQARAEFALLFGAGIDKARLVDATPIAGTPRQTVLYEARDGVVRRFDTSARYPLLGASTIPEPQLSTSAQYVASCVLFGKLFLSDGEHYYFVDPLNDSLRTWKPSDGGKMDPRNKLLVAWRGRAVIARGIDDPYAWSMSKLGDPFSFDQFLVPQLSTRAISGATSKVGACPDVINALYPYSDDLLLFFCDHSIWAIHGDPADPGRSSGFKEISSTIGGSFGRSVCSDPEGAVYFFGSQGGVYRMAGSGEPKSISDDAIMDELRNIDLGSYRAELEWNVDDNGLHVFFIAYATGETVAHYFWDRAQGGWFPDQFPLEPTACFVVDGDLPGDRKLLIATADGAVNFWDRTAKNDNGEAIETRMLIGPLAPEEADVEFRFSGMQAVLSRDSDPTVVRLYASDVPDKKGDPRVTFNLDAGRNGIYPVRMAGSYVFVEVTQKHSQRYVAFESMRFMSVVKAGRKRVRL